MCVCTSVSADSHQGQKRALDPWEVESQAVSELPSMDAETQTQADPLAKALGALDH